MLSSEIRKFICHDTSRGEWRGTAPVDRGGIIRMSLDLQVCAKNACHRRSRVVVVV